MWRRVRNQRPYLFGLAEIHRVQSIETQRSLWRRGMAALAAVARDRQPVPLEGLAPNELKISVSTALSAGLVDDLAFLNPGSAASALFELAAALPPCEPKRQLGRRVLTVLHSADAETFSILASSLALTSPRSLSSAKIRARVSLVLSLPYAVCTSVDNLALALISRQELVREWLSIPATGSLSSRRLAARLVERAARAAAFLTEAGDERALRVFDAEPVRAAWKLLMEDRESLVWRHLARARGILSAYQPELAEEINKALGPGQGITEWRTAATSLAASILVKGSLAVAQCRALLAGEIPHRDPGVAGAMAYGLSSAVDMANDAVLELLAELVPLGGMDVAEALIEVRRECNIPHFGATAAANLCAMLRAAPATVDDGLAGLRVSIIEELSNSVGAEQCSMLVARALAAFAAGDNEVRHFVGGILSSVEAHLRALDQADEEEAGHRRDTAMHLRTLDVNIIELSTVSSLLTVIAIPTESQRLVVIFDRLSKWLCARESRPVTSHGTVQHLTLRMRRLKALLHLLDAEVSDGDGQARERLMQSVRMLLVRMSSDPPSLLDRIVRAALARILDGLVRDGVIELSDVLMMVAQHARLASDVAVLAEATMLAELRDMYSGLCVLIDAQSSNDSELSETAIFELVKCLPLASSARVEALRRALRDLADGYTAIVSAKSIVELTPSADVGPLVLLRTGILRLSELYGGAQRRFGGKPQVTINKIENDITHLIGALARRKDNSDSAVISAVVSAESSCALGLPPFFAQMVKEVLVHLSHLDSGEPNSQGHLSKRATRGRDVVIGWLPPSRILGGFYVLKALGSGMGGSVFVACRSEQRQQANPETFALKVPEYNGSAAESLSESEFLQLFRQEAGALLALPEHRNLAHFVTFDAGAKPKPILVMELVDGPSLERIFEVRDLNYADVFSILFGVGKGLAAMHSVGVAHLDVKPSNIIIRNEQFDLQKLVLSGAQAAQPVLVDFGLAGRALRPGCGSAPYGAPEVWDPKAKFTDPPTAADVYSYCCLAYELFTGDLLYKGQTPLEIVTQHLCHDGMSPGIEKLATGASEPFAEILFRGLRRNASQRANIIDITEGIMRFGENMIGSSWRAGYQ